MLLTVVSLSWWWTNISLPCWGTMLKWTVVGCWRWGASGGVLVVGCWLGGADGGVLVVGCWWLGAGSAATEAHSLTSNFLRSDGQVPASKVSCSSGTCLS